MRQTLFALIVVLAAPAAALPVCGAGKRIDCVVDGDTFWHQGEKIRIEDIDTPEKGDLAECMAEGLLARQSTNRLAELLQEGDYMVERHGQDRYKRTLAVVSIDGKSVGAIMIEEGLARPWRGKTEDWCGE